MGLLNPPKVLRPLPRMWLGQVGNCTALHRALYKLAAEMLIRHICPPMHYVIGLVNTWPFWFDMVVSGPGNRCIRLYFNFRTAPLIDQPCGPTFDWTQAESLSSMNHACIAQRHALHHCVA
jgi:hypothetical protein